MYFGKLNFGKLNFGKLNFGKFPLTASLLMVLVVSLAACMGGGGGGGSDFVGAAIVNIDTTPNRIDPGDRSATRVLLNEVHENGILLKIRFPKGIKYVENSAKFRSDVVEEEEEIDAIFNDDSEDGFVYVVFCLPSSKFGDDRQGELNLELVGVSAVSDGRLGADPDVRESRSGSTCTFKIKNPEYNAEDDIKIEVIN
jgi:hypothetical protein